MEPRTVTEEELKSIVSERKADSHKGMNGKVVVIAGSLNYPGAASLASISAMRTGCDKVVLVSPRESALAVNYLEPSIISKKIEGGFFSEEDVDEVMETVRSESPDAVLVGPGVGEEQETTLFLKKIIPELVEQGPPLVLDADALKTVELERVKNCLLTPHREEFNKLSSEGLTGEWKRDIETVQNVSEENTVLLKGKNDVIVDCGGGRAAVNKNGNCGMTSAGTGDVLAGVCTGLLSLTGGKDLFRAGCAGAWLNGRAGDLLQEGKGYSFTAYDLAEKLSEVVKENTR